MYCKFRDLRSPLHERGTSQACQPWRKFLRQCLLALETIRSSIERFCYSSNLFQKSMPWAPKKKIAQEKKKITTGASEWFMNHTHSPNPFLLLSMACEANSRRQEDIPLPKSCGGENPALLLVDNPSSRKHDFSCWAHERWLRPVIALFPVTRRLSVQKSHAEIRSKCKLGQRRCCHLGTLLQLKLPELFLHPLGDICHRFPRCFSSSAMQNQLGENL